MNDALIRYKPNLPVAADSPDTVLSEAFSLWETRGRGWRVFDYPVNLEPPFCPLAALLSAPEMPVTDDGRKPTFWSNLFGSTKADQNGNAALAIYKEELAEYQELIAEVNEPPFCDYYGAEFIELQLILPKEFKLTKTIAENLLLSFSYLSYPVGFEIIGSAREIIIQFVCTEADAERVRQQLRAHLPECRFRERSDYLLNHWINADEESVMIVDFGLASDYCLPLKTNSHSDADFLVTVIGALENLRDGEIGVFQVLFQKCKQDWAQEIIEFVSYLEETGDYPKNWGRLPAAKEKVSSPLYAASIRAASRSNNSARTWSIVKAIGAGLTALSDPSGNELMPLSNDGYDSDNHEQGLVDRTSYRSGLLLNLEELALLVHLPSPLVQSGKLLRETTNTKSAPGLALHNSLILGDNLHQGEVTEVSLSNDQRSKHIHVIGASGSGKSSLLLNLIKQDLEDSQGLCVIDPHGDLIDSVIEQIPEHRIKDVILFDPADSEFPIGFNILSANSELEKTLLSSDLVAVFRRMSTSWGDVMDAVLANAILAFLESEKGGTLFDLKRFLVEKDFRDEFLSSVNDEAIRYFWGNEFPLITGKPQSSILIRLDTFLRQKLVRNIVCQKKNKIDFRSVMDNRKVLLVKLSQGLIGEENSHLLGSLLVSKLYQTALSRQDSNHRPFFSCYLDEFHHFITPSMENILSGARKYNLGLVLAHQEFRQLWSRNQEVASSVLSNCYTRICFRLGDQDADKFASGFSFFDGKALQNLGIGEAIGRIERAEFDFNLKTAMLPRVEKSLADKRRTSVLQNSRETYAQTKEEVERQITVQTQFSSSENFVKSNNTFVTQNTDVQSSTEPETKKNAFIQEVNQSKSLKDAIETKSGRGGAHHKELQAVIKRVGESYGFTVELEKSVGGGAGFVDVSLSKENLKIACEVSVTSNADYETKNVLKCLEAGYGYVFVISSNRRKIPALNVKLDAAIPPLLRPKVITGSITDLLVFLREQIFPNAGGRRKQGKSGGERLSFSEACKFFGIGASTLYRWIREGRVPFYRPGREYQFDRDELTLIGKQDLSATRKPKVNLSPLTLEKKVSKSKKAQDTRYRKLLKMD
jgi:excisionase family DNA binding protein